MPKISQSLGFTFRVGDPASNQYAKINVEISEVDTALPVEPQLAEAKQALNEVWKFIMSGVDKEVQKIASMGREA